MPFNGADSTLLAPKLPFDGATRLAATLQRVLATEGHDIEAAGDGLDALPRAGPVALMVNVALPVAVIALLRTAPR